jgi:hypothetical protein
VAHAFASRSIVIACIPIIFAPLSGSSAEEIPIKLVPHRAVYDLALGKTRGNSQVVGVRGRIVYDFDGSSCEGYSLKFRQVSELDSGEGKVSTSDLRSTTLEAGDANSFKFASENYLNDSLVDKVEGRAEHGASATAIDLVKPEQKKFDVDAGVVFPTEHMVRVIVAARAGKTILEFPVFDGSDTGQKVYDTLTVVGSKLSADERKHGDAADDSAKLAAVARWPVTISYFEKGAAKKSSEQTPVYALGFELYENGISRALSLDYNDFVVTGKLTSLEIKDLKPCP